MLRVRVDLLLVLALSLTAVPALAQSDPSAAARVHIGPLALSPSIALTDAGVDTNVFNSAEAPESDFRLIITPSADLWLHAGRALLSGRIRDDIVWYQKYSSERSVNSSEKFGIGLPLNRLIFNGSIGHLRTRERPGFEIDARAARREIGYEGAVEMLGFSKTFVGVRVLRQTVRFDEDAVFRDVNLHDELNRETISSAVTFRYQATALTAVVLEVSRVRDRFDFRPLGGSKSAETTVGLKFEPAALLKGVATFGHRRFEPDDPTVPSYEGSTGRVNLSYVAADSIKLVVEAVREVQYSFDLSQPYYLLTGFSGSVAQQIFGPVDVVGRAGFQRLAYRNRADAIEVGPERTDRVRSYGFGVGYHLGETFRVGVNVDHDNRESLVAFRNYDAWRIGATINYGL